MPLTTAEALTSHWFFLYSLLVAGVQDVAGAQMLAMRLALAADHARGYSGHPQWGENATILPVRASFWALW